MQGENKKCVSTLLKVQKERRNKKMKNRIKGTQKEVEVKSQKMEKNRREKAKGREENGHFLILFN